MEGDQRCQVDPIVEEDWVDQRRGRTFAHIGKATRNFTARHVRSGPLYREESSFDRAEGAIRPLFAKTTPNLDEQVEVTERAGNRRKSVPLETTGEERKVEAPSVVSDHALRVRDLQDERFEEPTLVGRVERDLLPQPKSAPLSPQRPGECDE